MSARQNIEEIETSPISWRDETVDLPAPIELDSGETLSRPAIALRIHGDPSKPVIIVAGGISAGRVVADVEGARGWWRDFVCKDGPIDPSVFCVVGFDFLPNAEEAATTITTHDQARALYQGLSALGLNRVFAFVGSSYGGMVALAFAELYPAALEHLVVISAAEKPHSFGTAVRGIQRRLIEFGQRHDDPEGGVSLARQLAMISYRTPGEFADRFAHAPGERAGDPYAVCDYLIARGEAFGMEPKRYLTLSDSIDRHRVDLSAITVRTLFVAAQGDQISPPSDIRRCSAAVPKSRYIEIFSHYGHDAFLKERDVLGPFIERFLKESE